MEFSIIFFIFLNEARLPLSAKKNYIRATTNLVIRKCSNYCRVLLSATNSPLSRYMRWSGNTWHYFIAKIYSVMLCHTYLSVLKGIHWELVLFSYLEGQIGWYDCLVHNTADSLTSHHPRVGTSSFSCLEAPSMKTSFPEKLFTLYLFSVGGWGSLYK